jgi:hypothetical protein
MPCPDRTAWLVSAPRLKGTAHSTHPHSNSAQTVSSTSVKETAHSTHTVTTLRQVISCVPSCLARIGRSCPRHVSFGHRGRRVLMVSRLMMSLVRYLSLLVLREANQRLRCNCDLEITHVHRWRGARRLLPVRSRVHNRRCIELSMPGSQPGARGTPHTLTHVLYVRKRARACMVA